jgi:AcrR family transcriptional regulator
MATEPTRRTEPARAIHLPPTLLVDGEPTIAGWLVDGPTDLDSVVARVDAFLARWNIAHVIESGLTPLDVYILARAADLLRRHDTPEAPVEAPALAVSPEERLEAIYAQLDPPPVQARAKATVRKLVEAADRFIADGRIDSFTSADVCAAVGLSIGIFYRYFDDRVHLLDLVAPDRYEADPGAAYLVKAAVGALELLPAPGVSNDAELAALRLTEALEHITPRMRDTAAALRGPGTVYGFEIVTGAEGVVGRFTSRQAAEDVLSRYRATRDGAFYLRTGSWQAGS